MSFSERETSRHWEIEYLWDIIHFIFHFSSFSGTHRHFIIIIRYDMKKAPDTCLSKAIVALHYFHCFPSQFTVFWDMSCIEGFPSSWMNTHMPSSEMSKKEIYRHTHRIHLLCLSSEFSSSSSFFFFRNIFSFYILLLRFSFFSSFFSFII